MLNEDEIKHWLVPRSGVINSYVATDADGNATDLCSFYHLPSCVLRNPLHNKLNACYSYYNVAGTVPLYDLMKDCMSMAKHREDQDVFNALNLMENEDVFEELKFGRGDGALHYYLYNWKMPLLKSKEIGLVLL